MLGWSWTAAATTLLDEVYAFLHSASWRVRSWSWTAAATIRRDEVYAFLRAARWRDQNWVWAATATTLLDEVYAFLRAARLRLLRARNWTWIAAAATLLEGQTSVLRPHSEMGAEECATGWELFCALRLLLPISGLAWRRWRRACNLMGASLRFRRRLRDRPGGGGGMTRSGCCFYVRQCRFQASPHQR